VRGAAVTLGIEYAVEVADEDDCVVIEIGILAQPLVKA
jgi:hypothetical protein